MENTIHPPSFTGPLPPPPPFALSCDLDPSCEHDVDLADDGDGEAELEAAALARATEPEGVEFLGTYGSIELYLRSQLEPEIAKGCHWIFGCLDYQAVQEQFESDGSRLVIEHGHVYRLILGLLMLLTITATGCIFDARGIGSDTGAESSTTGDRCCEDYPDAGKRASSGPIQTGGDEPADTSTSTKGAETTDAGSEPGSSSSTGSADASTGVAAGNTTGNTSTGEDAGSSTSSGGDLIPQGEPCTDDLECAPLEGAPDTEPMCLDGFCEISCLAPEQCPEGMMCLWHKDGVHHTCTTPI